jgi:hypothetical protein
MEFLPFKQAVSSQFTTIAKHPLFRVNVSKNDLWSTYQDSIFKDSELSYNECTLHSCIHCKKFIRDIGNVVAIIDGKLVSIWDISHIAYGAYYQPVANAMSALVTSASIADIFLHHEPTSGVDKPLEQLVDHFFVRIPPRFVKPKYSLQAKLSKARGEAVLLHYILTNISLEAVDTVLELISKGSLYDGDKYKPILIKFRKLLIDSIGTNLELFSWANHTSKVSNIHNTIIDSLLIDLSRGKELETAISSFEKQVILYNLIKTKRAVGKFISN